MNDAVKLEARLLSGAELELVAVTRPPEIERQSVDELKAAARRLREAHDRAKGIGTRQAREMRGKAESRGNRREGAGFARRARPGGGGTAPPRGGAALVASGAKPEIESSGRPATFFQSPRRIAACERGMRRRRSLGPQKADPLGFEPPLPAVGDGLGLAITACYSA
jgi:hypothetical protein